ncbi:MAG: DUF551 domain-containing protein [Enterobacter sp.]|uniref:DUF551 domain-containing protein n=1 Tax=Enterobacter sp. TaxID=42895 RepID=UPI00290D22F1|nr:DUF551 domain-containing protein [Enterobacter sp.]MDU7154832.1 DUF551 domain-containing protein [Enterobacter sp.]
MSTLTKEWLLKTIADLEEERDSMPGVVNEDAANALAAMKLALASLEAEPVGEVSEQRDGLVMDGTVDLGGASTHRIIKGASKMKRLPLGTKFYTAPPAPVSVPDAMEMDDDFDSAFEHGKAVGWNAYRAAMLQGADRPQNEPQNIPENIPATQFKPVADLYGLTSPTGGETSFTFDAVEARDFIDGGWSCQDYVELERFQEAMLQNGNSPAQSDCCPEQNYIAPAQDGDSPVIPDGWVACSEQMPEDEQEVIVQNKMGYRYVSYFDEHSGLFFDMRGGNQMNCIEHIFVTHWMPLPAAPQQEA